MKNVFAASAVAAALLAGSAVPSFADTITGAGTSTNPTKLSDYGRTGTLAFPNSGTKSYGKGAFSYSYYFSVDRDANLDGVVASSSTIYQGAPNLTFTSFQIVGLFGATAPNYNGTDYFPAIAGKSYTLTAGTTYDLIVKGNVSGGRGAFNGNLSVSAVPLPNSVALFGTAVLGLGVAGAVRRKKAAASAA